MEKPFTVTAPQTEELISLAEAKGLMVTVGHNLQFNPEAIRMREMVKAGFLGGPPIHLECMQSFSHAEPTYGTALLGDKTHWVRSLPGSLLHNLISHGIAKIAEFLPSSRPKVIAHVYSSPYLKSISQDDIVDELRALIHDDGNVTAHFTFSTQLGAAFNQLCLHGKNATLMTDSTNRMLIPIRQNGYKSYLRYFLTPHVYAKQYRRNSWRNIKQFLRKEFHMDYGMKVLIESFHSAVEGKAPLPISYKEILTTARIMDEIFAQIPQENHK
jgi:predicted dehydrogenase